MLPETFAADTCFLDVSQFCHTGGIVSVSKTRFCREAETYLLAGNSVSHVIKLGNIECLQQMFLATCLLVLPGLQTDSQFRSQWCPPQRELTLKLCFLFFFFLFQGAPQLTENYLDSKKVKAGLFIINNCNFSYSAKFDLHFIRVTVCRSLTWSIFCVESWSSCYILLLSVVWSYVIVPVFGKKG